MLCRIPTVVSVYKTEREGLKAAQSPPQTGECSQEYCQETISSDLSVALSSIEESITRLNKLGIAIRLSSRSTAIARARAFASQNSQLIQLNEFENRARLCLQLLYPNTLESLRQQLADAMTDRYAKIQYEAYRSKAVESDPKEPDTTSCYTSNTKDIPDRPKIGPDGSNSLQISVKENEVPVFNLAGRSTINTTLLRRNLEDVATVVTQSKPPKTLTILASQRREPPPPRFEDGTNYAHCNWCSQMIHRSMVRVSPNGLIEWSEIGRKAESHGIAIPSFQD
ncbi:hypothetical protein TWF173_004619 [Orbilia oligospora]|nr:hypothetical protein TWF173_004619 [Orbilia oligospora]